MGISQQFMSGSVAITPFSSAKNDSFECSNDLPNLSLGDVPMKAAGAVVPVVLGGTILVAECGA